MYVSEMFTRDKGSTVRRGPKPSAGAQIGWSREKDREILFRNFSTKEILSNIRAAFDPSKDVKEATLIFEIKYLFLNKNVNFWTSDGDDDVTMSHILCYRTCDSHYHVTFEAFLNRGVKSWSNRSKYSMLNHF